MRKHSPFNIIRPYLSASFAIIAIALLVVDFYFISDIEQHWITSLWAILIMATFVMIGQIANATKKNKSISTQLTTTKERLSNEIKHRLWAEKTTSETKIQYQFIDESFPVLLAYFNIAQRCRYHNRAYRSWLGLNANQIDGQLLQDFSGDEFGKSITSHMKSILAGKTILSERIQKSVEGISYNLVEQFIPHVDSKKKVIGFYTLYTPCAPEKKQTSTATGISSQASTKIISPELTAARIVQAIEDDEFRLYHQKFLSLKTNAVVPDHYEILIRMSEEESNLMPPGTFLPLVEKFKMMPRLDRWVVNYMVKWLSTHQTTPKAKFCLNIAKDTISCADFPAFVQDQLRQNKTPPDTLCFEIEESDALANPSATSLFTQKIRQLGCLVSICSVGYNQASVNLLKKINVDIIKIDRSLVYNIPHDEKDLAKVTAINQIAHKIKIQTVAELVETEEIMVKLREIGVDFAQGFGVARPRPLSELEKNSK